MLKMEPPKMKPYLAQTTVTAVHLVVAVAVLEM
jgi:hypothetical protein